MSDRKFKTVLGSAIKRMAPGDAVIVDGDRPVRGLEDYHDTTAGTLSIRASSVGIAKRACVPPQSAGRRGVFREALRCRRA